MALNVRKLFQRRRVVGLKNLGNTCYLNAVLQSLASTSSLHLFLENQKYLPNRPLTDALRETITELSLNSEKVIEPPKSIFAVKRLSYMLSSREQQDAHELMQVLMNILDDEHGQNNAPSLSSLKPSKPQNPSKKPLFSLSFSSSFSSSFFPYRPNPGLLSTHSLQFTPPFKRSPTSPTSFSRSYSTATSRVSSSSISNNNSTIPTQLLFSNPSKNPFYGLLSNTMKCNGCGRESSPHYQKFFGLSLPMPEVNGLQSNKECTLEKCLDLFTVQMVEGVAWDHNPPEKFIPTTTHLIAGDGQMRFMKNQQPFHEFANIGHQYDNSSYYSGSGSSNNSNNKPFAVDEGLVRPLAHLAATAPAASASSRLSRSSSYSSSSSFPLPQCSVTGTCDAFLNCNIAKPPKSLCLHLRRLITLAAGGNVKLETHVKFPLFLDLSAYCTTGLVEENERASVEYRLTSVIVHNGDVNGGHFTCFRHVCPTELNTKEEYQQSLKTAMEAGAQPFSPEEEGGAWFEISDDKPQLVAQEQVLACNAYMLYYEQRRSGSGGAGSSNNGLKVLQWYDIERDSKM